MANFECSICLGILKSPFECPNCHNNFCKEHINQLQRCPLCNMKDPPNNYIKNISLERIIDDFEFQCPKLCGFKCRGPVLLEKHLSQCNFTQVQCVLCKYQGSEEMFWAHLLDKHKKQIINQFGKILQNQIRFNNSDFLKSCTSTPIPNLSNVNPKLYTNEKPQITQTIYDKPQLQSEISNLIEKSQTSFRGNNSKNNFVSGFIENTSMPLETILEEENNLRGANRNNINLIPSLSDNNPDYHFRGSVYETKVYDNLNFTALTNNSNPYREINNNSMQNGIDYSINDNTNINGNVNGDANININGNTNANIYANTNNNVNQNANNNVNANINNINNNVNQNINNNVNPNINKNVNNVNPNINKKVNNVNPNINNNVKPNTNNKVNPNINNNINQNINNNANGNINNNVNGHINRHVNGNINTNVNGNHTNNNLPRNTNMINIPNVDPNNINYKNNVQMHMPNSAQKVANKNFEVNTPTKKYIMVKGNVVHQSPDARIRTNAANVNLVQPNNNRQIVYPNAVNMVSRRPQINPALINMVQARY